MKKNTRKHKKSVFLFEPGSRWFRCGRGRRKSILRRGRSALAQRQTWETRPESSRRSEHSRQRPRRKTRCHTHHATDTRKNTTRKTRPSSHNNINWKFRSSVVLRHHTTFKFPIIFLASKKKSNFLAKQMTFYMQIPILLFFIFFFFFNHQIGLLLLLLPRRLFACLQEQKCGSCLSRRKCS